MATALSLQCHQAAVQPVTTTTAALDVQHAAVAQPVAVAPPLAVAQPAAVALPQASVASVRGLTGATPGTLFEDDLALARRDPLAYFESCLAHYQREIRDYHCVFEKQEQLGGRLRVPQKAEVRFRDEPYSVDMTFVENVGDCKRALYVAGAWYDEDGVPQVWAKPGGKLLRALVPKIQQPVNGKRAQAASRRTIDEFGFERTLELIIKYSRKAQAAGELKLEFAGHGQIDGRPTFVFRRLLPYTGDEGVYPDRLLVLHIDREWKVPTAVNSYADAEGQQLLGSYAFSSVVLNPGYDGDDFDPEKIGF